MVSTVFLYNLFLSIHRISVLDKYRSNHVIFDLLRVPVICEEKNIVKASRLCVMRTVFFYLLINIRKLRGTGEKVPLQ